MKELVDANNVNYKSLSFLVCLKIQTSSLFVLSTNTRNANIVGTQTRFYNLFN